VCDVHAAGPDLATIDALARLHLAARRLGRELRVENAADELRELIVFVGLEGLLRLEPRGEAEEREQRLRVEEEGELGDPIG
jgi:hypothetical protein